MSVWFVATCIYICSLTASVHANNEVDSTRTTTGIAISSEIGPVQNLTFKIVNLITLRASWKRPLTTDDIKGYTLRCTDPKKGVSRTEEVRTVKESVQASLELQDQLVFFECQVWAFSAAVNGTPIRFNVTTSGLHPPENVILNATCDGKLVALWSYPYKDHAGFNLTLCRTGTEECSITLLSKKMRQHAFVVDLLDVQYLLNISATGKISDIYVESKAATADATAFPPVPLLTDVTVKGVSPEELHATWKRNWTHEIHFVICHSNSSKPECQDHYVAGVAHEANFTDLLPATVYHITISGQVTYGNTTCVGPELDQDVSTYSLHPAPIRNLRHTVENVTHLATSWDAPTETVNFDGYVLLCRENQSHDVSSTEVSHPIQHVKVTLDLKKQLATFHCEVWAYAKNGSERNNGSATSFAERTNGIAPPDNVTLVERTARSLAYSWSRNPEAPKCRVQVRTTNQSEAHETDCVGENDLFHYNVTGLTPGEHYEVTLQNCADYCGVKKVLEDYTDVAAPSEVGNFSAFINGFVNVTLTWTRPHEANGPIDGYLIHIVNNDTNSTMQILADGGTTNTTVDVNEEFSSYYGAISAYNVKQPEQEQLFDPATSVNFQSLGDGPFPPYPTIHGIKENEAVVSWKKAVDPRYVINSYNLSIEGQASSLTAGTDFNLTKLDPWTNYTVSVSSCSNETGCGQARSIAFTTDVAAPSKPTQLKAGQVSTEWLLIEWGRPEIANGPISGFNVSFEGKNISFAVTTTEFSYNASQLSPGVAYKVSVYAFNYGYYEEKCGPPATLTASTTNYAPTKGSASLIVLIIAVGVFLVTLAAVVGFLLWKNLKPRQRTVPTNEEQDTEMLTMKPRLRLRHKLCPKGTFGEEPSDQPVS
ncbi:hypothetical protein V5799_021754 [Amblyomma americanum]|uniref:Fibronectin type-III domain-containing protein n=1 Tax=Amblyomma americanum TaxID=6943 RepID=A0AAQ4FPT6_AMBAM